MLCPRYALDAFRSVNQKVNVSPIVIKTGRVTTEQAGLTAAVYFFGSRLMDFMV
ncbi:hypothetical protein DEO72_LG4g2862 [Vigna unguiculata]|uniref:Uncharacterized protein n=1 Tax=Vigna unguiculata TaxID=3917 RepID=A0A4D6LTW7_VIGUN|nr:hypothetical protein DEO72_LG4g2862 [Vigna unguiculata]